MSGFTLIEILITLIVMGALLGLGVVLVGGLQVQARDKERESDVQIIANGLEWRYENKNPVITGYTPAVMKSEFGYPAVREIQHALDESVAAGFTPGQVTGGYLTKLFKGSFDASFKTPSGGKFKLLCETPCATPTDATVIANAVGTGPDNYVYSPLAADNTVCMIGDCTKYMLYWRSEADGLIKTLNSRRS